MDDQHRLEALFDAGHPAIAIQTLEERDALELVAAIAREREHQFFVWSLLEGVRSPLKKDQKHVPETDNAAAGLFWLARQDLPHICAVLDVRPHLDDPQVMRALRRLIGRAGEVGAHLVLIDHAGPMPGVIEAHSTAFELGYPDDDTIGVLVKAELRQVHQRSSINISITESHFDALVRNLRGLMPRQVKQIVRDITADDRRLDKDDIAAVASRKRDMVGSSGTLEFVESPATLDHVGGLEHLKKWLSDRARSFSDGAAEFGLTPPRGVLLLGVQGAGKSLCAKAIATAWQRPLLRMDPGALYDRYIGESERRLRDALAQAEAMAPIVLWIDEIEKGFASAASHSNDGGLSQRMFGTLLTWMQDHESPVFLVATANNIDALPPELLRKGRFDEIFFVDLPGEDARQRIFEIHLAKRKREPGAFDVA
ncbi:MAG: AAA family ATPase, partial [Planctomycetota bacterium]